MKVRIFTSLKNGVYHARLQTEDWSENERELMKKYSEPEINLGGYFNYDDIKNWFEWNNNSGSVEISKKTLNNKSEIAFTDNGFKLDDNYARVMTESPFTQKFDLRDVVGLVADEHEAQILTEQLVYMWTRIVRDRIFKVVTELKYNIGAFNSKEEIFDLSSYNVEDTNDGETVE